MAALKWKRPRRARRRMPSTSASADYFHYAPTIPPAQAQFCSVFHPATPKSPNRSFHTQAATVKSCEKIGLGKVNTDTNVCATLQTQDFWPGGTGIPACVAFFYTPSVSASSINRTHSTRPRLSLTPARFLAAHLLRAQREVVVVLLCLLCASAVNQNSTHSPRFSASSRPAH